MKKGGGLESILDGRSTGTAVPKYTVYSDNRYLAKLNKN
jgi:hypothetical protein